MADDQLTALDATFLELEQIDRSAHMHIGGVMIFEPPPGVPPPTVADVRGLLDARLGRLPRFEQRLSEPHTGGLRWPRWVPDEDFDLTHHVHEVTLDPPAGEAELLRWAEDFYSRRLDRTRPLWEIAVCRLGDGRWAMVTKTHHCMVDGVGSVDIGQVLLETDPSSTSLGPPRTPRDDSAPDPEAAWYDPILAAARFGAGVARTGARAAQAVAGAVTHPDQARRALREAEAMIELVVRDEVIAAPTCSINAPIGPHRRLAVREFALDDLKTIKGALGGTVNDVVLDAATGGLRRLLRARGESLPRRGLRAMVPVNLRTAAERLGLGNRITSLFVHLPVAEPDPWRRYLQQLDDAEGLKASTQALGSRGLIDLTGLAPPALHSFLARSLYATRLFNVTITNVPGPQMPLYAFGGRMTAVWPLVPLAAEHAIGIAIFSYDGRVFFCVNADRESVPDVDLLADGIEESIAELRELVAQRILSATELAES
jgi:WS/DGAT/MGAT family acyltransferase